MTFHTNDDDKDNDTLVEVEVRLSDQRTVVAKLSDYLGHFPDHSDAGPFTFRLCQAATNLSISPLPHVVEDFRRRLARAISLLVYQIGARFLGHRHLAVVLAVLLQRAGDSSLSSQLGPSTPP